MFCNRSDHTVKRRRKKNKIMCFDSNLKKRVNSKKKIATKLITTRNIIQNKFNKVKKERILREKDLKDKYKPITNAIGKLGKEQLKSNH